MARLGASWNAYTSTNRVSFFISVPCEKAFEAAKIFADMMCNRTFNGDDMEKEKLVILEEERSARDDIDSIIYEEMDKFLCKGPISVPIIGVPETIKSIELDEVQDFHNYYYKPQKMLVTITGSDIDHVVIGELFGKDTGKFTRSKKESNEFLLRKRKNLRGKVQSARVMVCYRAFPLKHRYALDIQFMEKFFSDHMDSRLFQTLRQKHGLCYAVGSYTAFYNDIGWVIFWTNTSEVNVKKSIKLINKEITNLVENGPDKEEMERAKNKFMSEVYGRLETSYGLNSVLDFRHFFGLPDVEKFINRVKKMTRARVMKACNHVLTPENKQIFTYLPNKEE
jgi:predicted Zn-dependent peptidase